MTKLSHTMNASSPLHIPPQKHESRIECVVVPGTFDPITLGHLDVMVRAHKMFPKVCVGVASSAQKNGIGTNFSLSERVDMIKESLADIGINDIEVYAFEGLLVDFCKQHKAQGVVKGLRAMTDFEYELQQADLNWRMDKTIESIFVMSNPTYSYVSSSVVREISAMGADVSQLVPPCVLTHLQR